MRTSPCGRAVMHHFESCRLRAYPDPGSPLFAALTRAGIDPYGLTVVPAEFASLSGAPWTIGWGDTGRHVRCGLVISQAEADARFERRLAAEFEPAVSSMLTRRPTQGEFDALVCWAYNVGTEAARNSTLVRRFNSGDRSWRDEFARWNKSGGRVLRGLVRRRAAECALADGRPGHEAIEIGMACA